MKIFNSIICGAILLLCISSCEMKEELKNSANQGGSGKITMGVLSLDLSAKEESNRVTKSTSVSTEDFNVDIVRGDGTIYRSFDSYATFKEESPLEIPVGKYMIKASSPGEILSISKSPYFAGDKEISIEENLTSKATVSCGIQNVKFALKLSEKFEQTFSSCAVTLNSGTNLVYTQTSDDLDPLYLDAGQVDGVINLLVKGIKEDGSIVQIKRQLSKPVDYGESFGPGDFLDITLDVTDGEVDPDPEEPTQSNVSIKVKVDMTFDGSEETITVELEDENNSGSPDEPEVNPTLTCPYFSTPIVMSPTSPAPETVDVEVEAPGKIAKLLITITSNCEAFNETLAGMGIAETFDMADLNAEQKEHFDEIGLPYEGVKGETLYTFSIGSLIGLLTSFEGTHTFAIEVIDAEGASVSNSFRVDVTI